ncbi:MAG: sigma-54 dependent transcriptional regulator [Rhodospirillales bacterium]|nr:sigma-54 dependent transcriptional regulator [Rhodospirillales bacterium]
MERKHTALIDSRDYSGLCVLIVEDDEIMRLSVEDRLRLEGIPVRTACNLAEARRQLEKGDVDLVVTDIRLPDGSGSDLFSEISQHHLGIPVILMTAYGEVSDAVALVKAGAVDYLTKPFNIQEFVDQVRRNLSRVADTRISIDLTGVDEQSFRPGSGMLGKSASMKRIERLLARLSQVDSSILITGESGVGKEVLATLIHRNSPRASNPMVSVSCAALPPNLIESELFGHEKGAFTGAAVRRIGRFEQARNGTIFLDEIGEIPPEIQVKLLRVLQERIVERVGGNESIPLNVRIIAATQVDLEEAVRQGAFRSDLFWRLNVIHVHVPPLRDRPEDILFLARRFVKHHARELGGAMISLTAEAEAKLVSMSFPGNVRELKNVIERAIVLCDRNRIVAHDLMPLEETDEDFSETQVTPPLKESVEVAERHAIYQALVGNSWVIGKAADSLGISRKNLWEKMKRYGIEKNN